MKKIIIEIDETKKKADYQISINGEIEHEVKGLKFGDNDEILDWLGRSLRQLTVIKHPDKTIIKGNAKFAGYSEVSQAMAMIPVNEPFTTKDVTRIIVPEISSKFTQTNANISADFSAFKIANWYPDYLKVEGMRGRSRLYVKTKDVPAKQIEDDLRKAAKKAWP